MRDRIIFFVLGALLATLAYFAGDMQLSAHNTEIKGMQIIDKLLVREIQAKSILVGYSDTYQIRIDANHKGAILSLLSPNKTQDIILVVSKETGVGTFISIRDDTGKTRFMDTSSVNRFANP